MGPFFHPTTISIAVHVLILAGVAVRVIMHRPSPGVALAWLLLVAILPLLGLFLYLSFGERRVEQGRARRIEALRADFGDLLHTKSITVDDEVCMIGTVNLDMRSLWLNYEVSLFVYDSDFTKRLRTLQDEYLQECVPIDPAAWKARPPGVRFVENTLRLVSPLL